jgi:hypothetical protein
MRVLVRVVKETDLSSVAEKLASSNLAVPIFLHCKKIKIHHIQR